MEHYQGFYDWCLPGVLQDPPSGWVGYYAMNNDQGFLDRYVREYLGQQTVSVSVVTPITFNGCWYAHLYDYLVGGWAQLLTSCTRSESFSPGAGDGLYGWTAWETHGLLAQGTCPTVSNIRAMHISVANPSTSDWEDLPTADQNLFTTFAPCFTNFQGTPYTFTFPGGTTLLPSKSWLARTTPETLLQVTVSGPTVVGPNNYDCGQWVAAVQGGQTPYTYEWSGLFTSSDYYVTGVVPQTGGELFLTVTDNIGWQTEGHVVIAYDPNHGDYCQ